MGSIPISSKDSYCDLLLTLTEGTLRPLSGYVPSIPEQGCEGVHLGCGVGTMS